MYRFYNYGRVCIDSCMNDASVCIFTKNIRRFNVTQVCMIWIRKINR